MLYNRSLLFISFIHSSMYLFCVRPQSLQSCLTLCDPMDCSPPGSSVHGILRARVLEWVAMPSSRGSSRPRDRVHICRCLLHCRQILFIYLFIFISCRLITLQYCSGFCHTLTWISHGFTCAPHPDPPSHLPLHPNPLGLPSAPAPSTYLMHPTWAGDPFHPW